MIDRRVDISFGDICLLLAPILGLVIGVIVAVMVF